MKTIKVYIDYYKGIEIVSAFSWSWRYFSWVSLVEPHFNSMEQLKNFLHTMGIFKYRLIVRDNRKLNYMNAREAALWVLQSEEHFVLLGKRIIRGHIYEEYTYLPVMRVGGTFYHMKYEDKELKVDYSMPIFVDEQLNVVEE